MQAKFTDFTTLNEEQVHEYGRVYMLEKYPNYSRLKIGASTGAIELLMRLCDGLELPFYCLYVLVIGRRVTQGGRYQSPPIENRTELLDFLLDYQDLFESDGRHHLWVSSPESEATLVYDKHNLIYAYGSLADFATQLQNLGYKEQEFAMPFPHGHYYHAENDVKVEALLHHWEWQHSPLEEIDEE